MNSTLLHCLFEFRLEEFALQVKTQMEMQV